MKSKFFFTAGMIGMMTCVTSGATDLAESDYGRKWDPVRDVERRVSVRRENEIQLSLGRA